MKFTFCLFRYFPHGGLQRDCLALAKRLARNSHDITIVAGEWRGAVPQDIEVRDLKISAFTNHEFNRAFAAVLAQENSKNMGLVVGFDRMPGLDVYYAADGCYRWRHPGIGWLRRDRLFLAFETAVFAPGNKTEVLILSEQEGNRYRACYGTEDMRLHLLPPSIDPRFKRPPDWQTQRQQTRQGFGIEPHEVALLCVASSFRTKGVDRALKAMAKLSTLQRLKTRMLIVGEDDQRSLRRLARRFGVGGAVAFLGARDDVHEIMLAADLLLHPARHDNTGAVILEALAAGLPVLATAACGFSPHVKAANAGLILSEPFSQNLLDEALRQSVDQSLRTRWSENAAEYALEQDLYSGLDRAAELLEGFAHRQKAIGAA